jgi:hypothetical protein
LHSSGGKIFGGRCGKKRKKNMGYIFEPEVLSIINAVRAKTIGEEDDVLLKNVLGADIHPAIKAYFKAEVERKLESARATEVRSSNFSYGLPEVASLQQQIDLVLVQHYHFTRPEFEPLLEESVYFQFNYLCRPQWTLLNFIVGDIRSVQASVIEKKLRYCVDYVYFPELIKRYMVAHGLAGMTYEEFKAILEKIDNEVIAQHSSYELAQMTRALFAFVEFGKKVPQTDLTQQTLPINAAIVFFEDKQLDEIRARLEFERDKHSVDVLTIEQLADFIEIVRTGDEQAKAVPKPPPAAEEKPQHLPSPTVPTPMPSAMPPVIPMVLPTETPPPGNQNAPAGVPAKAEKRHVLVFGENDEQYIKATPGRKQYDFLAGFTEDEQERVIKKIFKNDKPAFLALVMAVSMAKEWAQAAHSLDALYMKNGIDPFSEDAVFFTDRLSGRFSAMR